MPFLVFDIETVPDTSIWTPAPPKPRARVKKDEFAPLYAHRVIVIGYALFDDNLMLGGVGAVANDNEPQLITQFSEWFAQQQATLVTFNGRGFDVPVLNLRALRHGIDQRYYGPQHRRRYDEENHLDLFAALTEYSALGRAGFSLGTLSTVIGLGGKSDFDGSMVAAAHAKGEIEKIRFYCMQDCARAGFLLQRYLLMRGRLTLDQYRAAANTLFDYCLTNKFAGVLFGADRARVCLDPPATATP
jgi:3'-5' exonuclease